MKTISFIAAVMAWENLLCVPKACADSSCLAEVQVARGKFLNFPNQTIPVLVFSGKTSPGAHLRLRIVPVNSRKVKTIEVQVLAGPDGKFFAAPPTTSDALALRHIGLASYFLECLSGTTTGIAQVGPFTYNAIPENSAPKYAVLVNGPAVAEKPKLPGARKNK